MPTKFRNTRLLAAVLLGASVLAGPVACKMGHRGDGASVAPAQGTALGINPGWMDKAVKPGDNFYDYADGRWMQSAQIPPDRSAIGAFSVADDTTKKQLAEIVADLKAKAPEAGSNAALVKTWYDAYMNTAAIEQAGMAPVQPDLDRIAAISDKTQLAKVLGENLRADVDPLNSTNFWTENLFGVFVTQALAGGDVVPYILQGGLGMPEREYFLSPDAKMAGYRKAYRGYIEKLLTDAGIADPAEKAQRIYDLEVKIATAHATREQSDDWQRAKQLWTPADFAAKAPGLDWTTFLGAAQLSTMSKIEAYHPDAIARLSKLVASEPLEAWKDWLVFHQINQNTAVLPAKLDADHFAFYGTTLSGAEQPRPREQRALLSIDANIGDAMGQIYTARFFPAEEKTAIQGMVANIKDAFAQRIAALDWMAPTTKQEAEAKVKSIEVGIGYPDHWTDYTGLKIAADTPYANQQAADALRYKQQLAKVGKPQDKGEWWMNAQLVNAVNLPVQNALNFPAAILQPPFYDRNADPAYNYGAIGAVIGHEISHSFDNNGAAFDATGAMRNWWTDADRKRFDEAGKALAQQYDAYEPFPGLHVKGELTLSENIADVAGLAAALDAYHASLGGKPAPVIDGFTGDQRFFIAYAQTWATKMREAALRARIATDGHAPGMYRALTVRNLDDWYKAFDVKPGEKLYLAPGERVKVW